VDHVNSELTICLDFGLAGKSASGHQELRTQRPQTMPIPLYDRFHRYVVVALISGGAAMMTAAWLWDGM
jgi:hypothetical protein